MMKWMLTAVLALAMACGWAQVKEPLPVGAVQFSQQLWLNPVDSTVWTGSFGTYINLGGWKKVQDLIDQGWSPTQIDSAITANLADYIPLSQKGASNGVATLDINSKVPMAQIPDALVGSVNYQGNYNAATNTPTLPVSPGTGTKGHYYVVSTGGTQFGETFVSGDWIISNGSEWQKVDNNNAVTSVNGKVGAVTLTPSDVGALQAGDNLSDLVNDVPYLTSGDLPAPPVTSVNGKTGAVIIDKGDLNLENVNNTSDANKPISDATAAALAGKETTFSKGNLVAGTGVTLSGALANRLVGSGNVTINAANSLTASNGLQISSGNITPVYGTGSGSVAQGNDSRINNGQTAFLWGDYRNYGLGVSLSVMDADVLTGNQFFSTSSAHAFGFGSGIQFQRQESQLRGGQIHIANGSAVTEPIVKVRAGSTGGWGPIRTLWHDGNFTPPAAFTRSVNGLVPAPGGSGTTRFLREDGSWTVPDGGGGGGTATDLSIQNRTSTTLQIGSSTGSAATIPIATTSLGGLMSATDKTKLNNAITDYTESDPSVPGHVKAITSTNISNWNTAHNWGNHASANYFSTNFNTVPSALQFAGDFNTLPLGNYTSGISTFTTNRPDGAATGGFISFGSTDNAIQVGRLVTGRAGLDEMWYSSGIATNPYYRAASREWTGANYLSIANFTWSNLSGKPSTFTPSAHTHNASDINSGTLPFARIPTGTSGSTVAVGNHTHTFASITSKPSTLSGYGITNGVPTNRTITINGLTYSLANNRSWTLTASDVGAIDQSFADGRYAFKTQAFSVDYNNVVSASQFAGDFNNLPLGSYAAGISNFSTNRPHTDATGGFISFGSTDNANQVGRIVTGRAGGDAMWYSSGDPDNEYHRVASREWVGMQGYLTSFTESDPTVPGHVKAISSTNISNWNTVYGWGDFRDYGLGINPVIKDADAISESQFFSTSSSHAFGFGSGIHMGRSDGSNQRAGQLLIENGSSGTEPVLKVRGLYGNGWTPIRTVWHDGNFTPSNYAQLGTGSTQVRNNSQLDGRYLQQLNFTWSGLAGKPTTLSGYGITDAVPNTRTINGQALSTNVTLTASDVSAVPLSGSATITGAKTFSSPVAVANATNSNHAVNKGQLDAAIAGTGNATLGTTGNTVKVNYQNDTTFMRFKNVLKVTTNVTLPENFPSGTQISKTVPVEGAEVGDAVIVNAHWLSGGMVVNSSVTSSGIVTITVFNAGTTTGVASSNTVYVTVITNRVMYVTGPTIE